MYRARQLCAAWMYAEVQQCLNISCKSSDGRSRSIFFSLLLVDLTLNLACKNRNPNDFVIVQLRLIRYPAISNLHENSLALTDLKNGFFKEKCIVEK